MTLSGMVQILVSDMFPCVQVNEVAQSYLAFKVSSILPHHRLVIKLEADIVVSAAFRFANQAVRHHEIDDFVIHLDIVAITVEENRSAIHRILTFVAYAILMCFLAYLLGKFQVVGEVYPFPRLVVVQFYSLVRNEMIVSPCPNHCLAPFALVQRLA